MNLIFEHAGRESRTSWSQTQEFPAGSKMREEPSGKQVKYNVKQPLGSLHGSEGWETEGWGPIAKLQGGYIGGCCTHCTKERLRL